MTIPHGSSSGYSHHGCRCDVCVEAKRARDRDYYERTRGDRARKVVLSPEERSRKAVERTIAWRKANPDKDKAQRERHRDNHREQRREDSLARYYKQMEENPEKVRQQRREWKRTDKGRAYQRVANYRRRSLPMSKEVRDWWLEQRNAVCAYCQLAMATEIDHIVPVTKGGTNDRDNLVPACRSCNASKNDKTLTEWMEGVS